MDDLNRLILQELKAINNDAGQFVVGILSFDISRDDQISFALHLVVLAEHIKDRALRTPGLVVEGSVVNDSNGGITDTAHSEEASDGSGQSSAVRE
jgi:hypothetical protein